MRRRKSRGGGEFDGNLDGFGPHVIALHHSDQCGHCKTFKPEWKKVVKHLRKIDPSLLTVAEAGPAATEHMNDAYYETPITGVPTIMYIHKINNNKVRPTVYTGARTANAIIEWVAKLLAKNKVKITIESNDLPKEEEEESKEEEDEVKEAKEEEPTTDNPAMITYPEPIAQVAQGADASASTLTKTADTIKTTAAAVDNKIEEGVSAVKSAFTKDLDFENLFSSKPAAAANSDAQANGLDLNPANGVDAANGVDPAQNPDQPQNPDQLQNPDLQPARTNAAPAVPSLVGGRKYTRRAKSNRKSKRKTKRKSNRKK